jgi:hypothetical protein
MRDLGYPKYGKAQLSGRAGESFVDDFIRRKLGWIYRPTHQESDFGIDGYVDFVTDGNVTGQTIALQIKCGDSYYNKKSAGGIRYEGASKHLNFYLNGPCPVLLLVLNTDCTEARWVQFNASITSKSGEGWWIEVPEGNVFDASVKQSWGAIVGPAIDYSEDLDVSWRVNKALDESDFGMYLVHKDDVLSCDFSGVRDCMDRLSRNKTALLRNRGTLEVLIAGYDDDPREVCEIPEIRRWYSESVKAGIPWFYFIGKNVNGMGISTLLFSCCDMEIKPNEDGMRVVRLLDIDQVDEWLTQNFENLNRFCDERDVSEEVNKEMSEIATDIIRRSVPGMIIGTAGKPG